MSLAKPHEPSVGIILQARMGSTRLPGKVLMPFGNTTLLGWILARLAHLPWPVVVATSTQEQDKAIVTYCIELSVPCFRGSEQDVLDRYYQCALAYSFDHVVRLTGDNPFPDTEELARMIDHHVNSGSDYTHNIGTLPIGVGAEILSVAALERSWKEGHQPQHREHVNEYILENPELFITSHVAAPSQKHSSMPLTIDTHADYQRIRGYLQQCSDMPITTQILLERCTFSA